MIVTYYSEKRNASLTPTGSRVTGQYHDGYAAGVNLVLDMIKSQANK